ncbi:MAG: hypothetical protein ACOYN0_13580, partial [Phycisphaerales bacterium]
MSVDDPTNLDRSINCTPTKIVCKRGGKSGYFYKCGTDLVCFVDKEISDDSATVGDVRVEPIKPDSPIV